jgi:glutathione synthase/RimK-type ligase-like ATP-grasp enzyme
MEITDSRFYLDPTFLKEQCETLLSKGLLLDSSAYSIAAQWLDQILHSEAPFDARPILNVAIGYLMMGDLVQSEKWFGFVLHHEPKNAIALMNLGAILTQTNRKHQGTELLDSAYKIQRLFIEPVDAPSRKLLILSLGKVAANIPLFPLLSLGRNLNIKYAFDYGSSDEDAQLPDFDIVFNAIGEADFLSPFVPRILELSYRYQKPLLNHPQAVINTQRHQLRSTLQHIHNLVLPNYLRFPSLGDADFPLEAISQQGIDYPIIIRPEGTHGGDGLNIVHQPSELSDIAATFTSSFYIANFIHYQSADTYFRKYRVIFVDRIPYFYHLAISSHWLVHYYSSEMLNHPWKIQEEKDFLYSPESILGEAGMKTLLEIGQALNLEYVGIDFGIMPDRSLVIFEANPTMLIHFENISGPLAYKNEFVKNILQAFEDMLNRLSPPPQYVS